MTTALDLITGAAKLIGVVRKSEALTADEAADGLVSLNDMLASWANNGLLVQARTWESFTVASATSYTIGSGQTLSTVNPLVIKEAFFRIDSIDYPLEIITDEEFQQITMKTMDTGYPEFLNYDNGYPTGRIRLYPQGAGQLHLLTEKPLTAFSSLSTEVTLSPGWNRLLRYNLAIEISGEYAVDVPATVVKIASDAMTAVMRTIAKNRPIKRVRNRTSQNQVAAITAG
jgi:hypothetical protein